MLLEGHADLIRFEKRTEHRKLLQVLGDQNHHKLPSMMHLEAEVDQHQVRARWDLRPSDLGEEPGQEGIAADLTLVSLDMSIQGSEVCQQARKDLSLTTRSWELDSHSSMTVLARDLMKMS